MYRYDIPRRFPVGEAISTTELAQRCNANEDALARLVQHAVTKRFLAQPEAGVVAHTAFSAMMAAQPAISDFVGYVCEDLRPAAASIPDALAKWPGPPWLPNQTGHNLATGTTGTFWDSLASEPARSRRFASSMSLMQRMPGWQPAAAVEVFDWGALSPDAVVVDVGGGDGSFAVALAERFPALKHIIVQDVADVIERSRAAVPESLRGIITPLVADFFEPQTVEGAAIYVLRKVLHDWSDEFAIRILQQLVPALKPGAPLRGQDLAMMALFNSKERTREQWTDLIRRADQRFVIESVTRIPPGPLALIVVVWE
ncbi:hypothetical protein SLS64_012784 [Diaporthe eres]|uniref:O-methyltransferase C-terminal domain-containing protein n=1 Tax=Diaporthe eres TaxID=83184 RepID=A0ABR1P967_DIAER